MSATGNQFALPYLRPNKLHIQVKYSGSQSGWKASYRAARANPDNELAYKLNGIQWKAYLILQDRDRPDPLAMNAKDKLKVNKIVDEILAEEQQGGSHD